MDDLVAKLRAVAGAPLTDWAREHVLEAADRIEKLEAENARLRDDEFWMDLIEPITRAIVFEDCGNTADWPENTHLGIAVVNKIRPLVMPAPPSPTIGG